MTLVRDCMNNGSRCVYRLYKYGCTNGGVVHEHETNCDYYEPFEKCIECGKEFKQWNPRLYIYYCKDCNDKAMYNEAVKKLEGKNDASKKM